MMKNVLARLEDDGNINWDETSSWSKADLEEKENQVDVMKEIKPDAKPEVEPEVKPGNSPKRVKSEMEEEVTAKPPNKRSAAVRPARNYASSNRENGHGPELELATPVMKVEPDSVSSENNRRVSFEEIPTATRQSEQDSPLPFKIDDDDDWLPTLEYLPVTSRDTPPYQLDDDLASGPDNDPKVKVRVTPDDPLVWEDDEVTPLFHGFKPSEIRYDVDLPV